MLQPRQIIKESKELGRASFRDDFTNEERARPCDSPMATILLTGSDAFDTKWKDNFSR